MTIRMELMEDGYTKRWLVFDANGALILITTSEALAYKENKCYQDKK